MNRLTDAELSRAVQSRDEAAMEVIINRYSRLLWRVCAAVLSKSGGTQDVEECVADAFVYLWRYPERYDSSRSTLKTFLCMVARSRAMDRYRSLMRSRTVPMEEGLAAQTLDISAQALSAETRQELTAAFIPCRKKSRICCCAGIWAIRSRARLPWRWALHPARCRTAFIVRGAGCAHS